MQLSEHTELAAHIVRGFDFAAEGRSAQNHFLAPETHQVGQIGVAARELFDHEGSGLTGKMAAQERLELGQVEFFAGSYSGCAISKIAHGWLGEAGHCRARKTGLMWLVQTG